MAEGHSEVVEKDRRLDEVVFAYLRDAEAGRAPGRDEWLAQHPDLAGELTDFLANQERLERLAAPLRQVTRPGGAEETPRVGGGGDSPAGGVGLSFGDYELLEVIGQGG